MLPVNLRKAPFNNRIKNIKSDANSNPSKEVFIAIEPIAIGTKLLLLERIKKIPPPIHANGIIQRRGILPMLFPADDVDEIVH